MCNLLKKPSNINIQGSYFKLKNVCFDIDRKSELKVVLGKGARLNNLKFFIRGTGHLVKIGEGVRISEGIIWMEDTNCKVIIGDRTTVESVEFACTEPSSEINIGSDCMFSKGIELRTGDSHSIFELNTKKRINYAQNINIENKVWIGAHSRILKGARIESEVIIGIGSLVLNGNVLKSNSVYGGVPAKLLKLNVTWDRERIYK
jgi:acetyltransferase-like isoleucine patch superfamily enzyme